MKVKFTVTKLCEVEVDDIDMRKCSPLCPFIDISRATITPSTSTGTTSVYISHCDCRLLGDNRKLRLDGNMAIRSAKCINSQIMSLLMRTDQSAKKEKS
jgi:hypothetical protein